VVHRDVPSLLPLLCCCPSLLQPGCTRQELDDEVLEQAAPLVELSRLKARRLDPGAHAQPRNRGALARPCVPR
jgi:hypothetical protein